MGGGVARAPLPGKMAEMARHGLGKEGHERGEGFPSLLF